MTIEEVRNMDNEEVEEVEYLNVEEGRIINWENVDEVVYDEEDVDDMYMFIEGIIKGKLGMYEEFSDEEVMDDMSNKIQTKLQDLAVEANDVYQEYFESVVKYLRGMWFENGEWNITDGAKQMIFDVVDLVLNDE